MDEKTLLGRIQSVGAFVQSLSEQQQKLLSAPRLALDDLLYQATSHLEAQSTKHLPVHRHAHASISSGSE